MELLQGIFSFSPRLVDDFPSYMAIYYKPPFILDFRHGSSRLSALKLPKNLFTPSTNLASEMWLFLTVLGMVIPPISWDITSITPTYVYGGFHGHGATPIAGCFRMENPL